MQTTSQLPRRFNYTLYDSGINNCESTPYSTLPNEETAFSDLRTDNRYDVSTVKTVTMQLFEPVSHFEPYQTGLEDIPSNLRSENDSDCFRKLMGPDFGTILSKFDDDFFKSRQSLFDKPRMSPHSEITRKISPFKHEPFEILNSKQRMPKERQIEMSGKIGYKIQNGNVTINIGQIGNKRNGGLTGTLQLHLVRMRDFYNPDLQQWSHPKYFTSVYKIALRKELEGNHSFLDIVYGGTQRMDNPSDDEYRKSFVLFLQEYSGGAYQIVDFMNFSQ